MSQVLSLADIAAQLSGYDPNALPVAQAQAFSARLVPRVEAVEMLPLRSALNRVLARDLVSPFNVPAHDNSAMDGYALRGADLSPSAPTRLALRDGSSLAGQPFAGAAVLPGQCLRITTGAVMPGGTSTASAPSRVTNSCGSTVSSPDGITAPVVMRRHWPGNTAAPANGCPARLVPSRSARRVGALGERSAPRKA